jgi:hypothetical protein
MSDITNLLARLRGEPPPESPYDPAAARAARSSAAGGERQEAAPA